MIRTNQRGQSVVEFAVVLPFLLLLLMGAIEFTVILYDKAVITNASREGARLGISTPYSSTQPYANATQVKQAVYDYCTQRLITFSGSNNLDMNLITLSGMGGATGTQLTVSVQFNYGFLVFPRLLGWSQSTLPLNAATTMLFM